MKKLEESSSIAVKSLDDIKVVIAINSNKENEKFWDNFDLILNQFWNIIQIQKSVKKKSLSKKVHKDRIENLIINTPNQKKSENKMMKKLVGQLMIRQLNIKMKSKISIRN